MQRTAEITFDLILRSSTYTSMYHVIESVESSTNLFFNSIIYQANNVVKGLYGDGMVSFLDARTQITPLRSVENEANCKFYENVKIYVRIHCVLFSKVIQINLSYLVCDEIAVEESCNVVKLIVFFTYQSPVTKNDIKHEILQRSAELVSVISNDIIQVHYFGPIPVMFKSMFILTGTNLMLMEKKGIISYYETTLAKFFNDIIFEDRSFHVNDIRVDNQEIKMNQNISEGVRPTHEGPSRFRTHENITETQSLKVFTTIRGEYVPPPILDFSEVVEIKFNEVSPDFIHILQGRSLFRAVEYITVTSLDSTVSDRIDVQSVDQRTVFGRKHSPAQNNLLELKEFSIPLYIILFAFVLMSVAYMVKPRETARKVEVIEMRSKNSEDSSSDKNISMKSFRPQFIRRLSSEGSHTLISEKRLYSLRNLDALGESGEIRL